VKERNGKITKEWSYRFYVKKKQPIDKIPVEEIIPSTIKGLQTDVIPHFEKESLVCDTSTLSIDSNGYRDDGLRGGISIRNEHFDNDQPSGYGTLGILARRTNDNALVGLTCAHVVNAASESLTTLNTKIGQPKYYMSCCCCPYGYIGDVAAATFSEDLDCAIIDIHDDLLDKITTHSTENKIEGIADNITGAAIAIINDTVRKRGRATGLSTGTITDVAYGTNNMLIECSGGGATDPFACYGDSGSVIINSSDEVVGILVGAAKADMKKGIATHILPVMNSLGISIAGVDAAGVETPNLDWLFRSGGFANNADNETEVFNKSDFGLSGSANWDVDDGGTNGLIVETNGVTANGRDSITVRFDHASSDQARANAVVIKVTDPATNISYTKLRTVLTPEWAAWPGGQADNAVNPTETINAADMGFPAGTLLNWDVGQSNTNGLILAAAGTTSNAVASIQVRYDNRSNDIAAGNAVRIFAQNPVDNRVAIKLRTIFTTAPQVINTSNPMDADDNMRFNASFGPNTAQAEFVDTTMPGVSRTGAKVEQIWDILPQSIPWSRRHVQFKFEQDPIGGNEPTNAKFEVKCRRERIAILIARATAANQRDFVGTAQDGPVNDPDWTNDGASDPGDCQYPTDAKPDKIFRRDNPSLVDRYQGALRSDFREFIEFHNGTAWVRFTPFSLWFTNATLVIPAAPSVVAVGGTNNSGAGQGAVNVPNVTPVVNAGANQNVAQGSNVTLQATVTDNDNDKIVNVEWNQTAGTPVVLTQTDAIGLRQTFTAPGIAGSLTFEVFVDDVTSQCFFYNPGNGSSNIDSVDIIVT
ncbi:S1 family peptidase, partial [Draconibacterium sp.]|nr:S1 family peptidase [Draconibacterium sp.]